MANCPDPATARALLSHNGDGGMHFWALDWASYRQMRTELSASAGNPTFSYGIELPEDFREFEEAVVFLPRQRGLAEYLIAHVGSRVRRSGPIRLVGLIRAGARSLVPPIERELGRITGSFSARHSRLYLVENRAQPGLEKALSDWVAWHHVDAIGHGLKIAALPGVFGQGRLDPGTRLLLETLREPKAGRILDFGCGCGVIGAAVMKAWPAARVELTDSDAAAIWSARLTLAANDLKEEGVRPSDVFSELPGRYDFIISNPPYHSRMEVDWGVAETLARQAPSHLARRGRLRLVTNQYPRWRQIARRMLSEPEILARTGSFHVLEIGVPRSPSRGKGS